VSTATPEPRRPERKGDKPEKKADKKADDRRRVARLDMPRELRRSVMGRQFGRALNRGVTDQDRFGRFAEQFARYMGTARFLIYMTLVVAVWIGWNFLAPADIRFDDYPFIFLTLILSLQASYAAPLILLAQNRQELRDRVVTEQDRQANARAHADMEFLAREVAALRMALGEVATRDFLRSELRGLLQELEETQAGDGDDRDRPESEKGHTARTTDRDGTN
jgi:uncharacterized membrane protein